MARAISKMFFILGSYNFLASLECIRSYAWSSGHSEPDLSSVKSIIYVLIVINLIYLAIEGDLETIMVGLNCGVPSGIGWPIFKDAATAFLSWDDYGNTGCGVLKRGIQN